MENFLNSEAVQTFVLYSCFGAILGYNLFWIGYGVDSGVKWLIKKFKKEKKTNE